MTMHYYYAYENSSEGYFSYNSTWSEVLLRLPSFLPIANASLGQAQGCLFQEGVQGPGTLSGSRGLGLEELGNPPAHAP